MFEYPDLKHTYTHTLSQINKQQMPKLPLKSCSCLLDTFSSGERKPGITFNVGEGEASKGIHPVVVDI